MRCLLLSCVAVAAGLALALSTASLAHAESFTYILGNHPDGSANPPAYGLRLDGLFDGDQDTTVTFDFEYGTSAMYLTYDSTAGTVHIYGTVYGGEDSGTGYSGTPTYYEVDFLYSANVSNVDGSFDGTGDEKLKVTAEDHTLNVGTIKRISDGETWDLEDEQGSHTYSFKFNNTDDHRLPSSLQNKGVFVGWGWLNHSGQSHLYDSDWLFTATPVPEPGTFLLMGMSLVGAAAVVRRRRAARDSD